MARQYRSYKGEPLDFDLMARKNANQIAVGNASMNARGDLIGKGGKVIQTLEQRIAQTSQVAAAVGTAYNPNVKGAVQMVSIKDNVDKMTVQDKMKEMAKAVDTAPTAQEVVKEAKGEDTSNKRKVVDKDE